MAQNIKQLYSLDLNRANAFIPRTTADSVEGLEELLSGFNMYSVAYTGSVESTRLSVPERLRRQGLWITYVKYDNTTITERYDHNDISPNEWKKTENWRGSVDLFGGTIEIGLNGNWFINGIDTGKKAVGSLAGFNYRVNSNGDNDINIAYKLDSYTDLVVLVGKCGVNELPQFKLFKLISNRTRTISSTDSTPDTTINIGSDYIGPYIMTADSGGNGLSGFTGGWHGYNGDLTGAATAHNVSMTVYCDGTFLNPEQVSSKDIWCNEVKIIVKNRLNAGNTKLADGNGRDVLEEIVTYHFLNKRVYVSVRFKALENIHIDRYYGMQFTNFAHNRSFITESGLIKVAPDNTLFLVNERVYDIFAEISSSNNFGILAHLDKRGIPDKWANANQNLYAFCIGPGSTKCYFGLILYPSLAVTAGLEYFWSGYYEFTKDIKTF